MPKRLELSLKKERIPVPKTDTKVGGPALRSTVVLKNTEEIPRNDFVQDEPLLENGGSGAVPDVGPEMQQTDDSWTVLVPSDQSWRRE